MSGDGLMFAGACIMALILVVYGVATSVLFWLSGDRAQAICIAALLTGAVLIIAGMVLNGLAL